MLIMVIVGKVAPKAVESAIIVKNSPALRCAKGTPAMTIPPTSAI
jgi:hypothetical protein